MLDSVKLFHVVWEDVIVRDSKWAIPSDEDARKKMRDVYKNYTKWKKTAKTLAKSYKDEAFMYDKFNKAINANNDETVQDTTEGIELL